MFLRTRQNARPTILLGSHSVSRQKKNLQTRIKLWYDLVGEKKKNIKTLLLPENIFIRDFHEKEKKENPPNRYFTHSIPGRYASLTMNRNNSSYNSDDELTIDEYNNT